jgi:predicted lysophospholipase L1 biosynthesis ABC-type transport system permease subunit
MSRGPRRVEIRPPLGPPLYMASVMGAGFVALAVVVGLDRGAWWEALGIVAASALVFGMLITLVARVAVVADGEGLVVRNLRGSWRLAWSDVEDFRAADEGGELGLYVLLTAGDRMLPLDATRLRWGSHRDPAEIERLLRGLRACIPR